MSTTDMVNKVVTTSWEYNVAKMVHTIHFILSTFAFMHLADGFIQSA